MSDAGSDISSQSASVIFLVENRGGGEQARQGEPPVDVHEAIQSKEKDDGKAVLTQQPSQDDDDDVMIIE